MKLVLFLIVVLAIVLRLYHFTQDPPHLFWDEASWAYNAYSLVQTGKDEWGVPHPVIIRSFDDYKLPLYAYLTAAVQKFSVLSDASVRLPSIFFGVITVITTFFLLRQLSASLRLSLLGAFLLSISMWHLQFSRVGFEPVVSLSLTTLGALFFLIAVQRLFWLLPVSSIFFVAALYTYHSATITVPLTALVLVTLFYRQLLKNFKITLVAVGLTLVLSTPYLVNYWFSPVGQLRPRSESILTLKGNPVINFTNNLVTNFSLNYLFFQGDQNGRHSVKKLGELYLWQLPTVLAGVFCLLKKRGKLAIVVLSWVLIGSLPVALSNTSPHSSRGMFSVWGWQVISAVGLLYLLGNLPKIFGLLTVFAVCYSLFLYLHVYYFHYPKAYAADWQDGRRQTVAYLKTVEGNYDKIFVWKTFEPIYFLLYLPYPPSALQSSGHDLSRFGKYIYIDFDSFPRKTSPHDKYLIVGPPWLVPKEVSVLREIKSASGDPVFDIYEL